MEETTKINSISCPVCQNLCSSQAVSCPKCGHPFVNDNADTLHASMKVGLTKNHIITAVIAFTLVCFLGLFLYNRSGNGIDEKLKTLRDQSRELGLKEHCKKFNLSEKECKETGDESKNLSSDFVKEVNNNCEIRKYSEKKCEEYKEFVSENIRRQINGEETITDEKYLPLKR